MKCKHCGEEIIIGSRFCSCCSAPIDYDMRTQELIEKNEIARKQQVKIKTMKHNLWILFVVLIIVSCVSFIFYNVFYDKSNNEFTTNKVTTVVDNIKEQKELEDKKKIDKLTVEIGESCVSESYEVNLLDCDIIDDNHKDANFYTIIDGQELVFVKIQMYNRSYQDAVYSSLVNFMGSYNGQLISPNMSGLISDRKYKSIDGNNYRRKTKEGYLCYSLPKGWKYFSVILNIDNIEEVEGEPVLFVENPKNREIKEEELLKIREDNKIDDFLYDNNLGYLSEEEINNCIINFMHQNCLSKLDRVPKSELKDFIKKTFVK